MACDCEFVGEIKVQCVLEIVRIVRGGDVLAARAELLQHVGCVLGSLGKYMEGQAEAMAAALPVAPCSVEECVDEIERLLPSPETMGTLAINPALLALLLKLAELLIEKYLG